MPDTSDLGLIGSLLSAGTVIFVITMLTAAWFVVRTIRFILQRLASRSDQRRLMLLRFMPVLSMSIWGITIFLTVILVFDPNSSTMAALVGATVFALGFAGQDLVKNILGGIVILTDRPFQVGDKVEIAPYYGEIVAIGLRSTRLVTNDDSLVTVPNSKMLDQAISNGNAGALDFQVVIDTYLPQYCDLDLAQHLAWQAAASSPYVFLDKPIVVRLAEQVGDDVFTRLRIKAYVLDIRYEVAFQSDVHVRAKKAYMSAGLLPPEGHSSAPRDSLESAVEVPQ
ncbi:MAG: mechanosensitive ion channel [Myxococcota bacterium]|jgi:small-conductance mechanosensitive channel|nr:mechanosensitive ion channel [Myxococcota bacterium]